MKLFTIISTFSIFVAGTLAQRAQIISPAVGSTIPFNESFNVQVSLFDSLTSSVQLSAAVGIRQCPTTPCNITDDFLGTLLAFGVFNPQRHDDFDQPYQNYTVNVNNTLFAAGGTALLRVAQFYLLGASFGPIAEVVNASVTVAAT